MDQEATLLQRLERQHADFVGRDQEALRKRKPGCRTRRSLVFWGVACLLLLFFAFSLYDMPSVTVRNFVEAWYEAGAEILKKMHGL